ncbi:MAG: hypothetical protein OEL53_07875 [Rhodospirillales bacterium]|nr:hypothetical protein [Rhodospirillales bacterium]
MSLASVQNSETILPPGFEPTVRGEQAPFSNQSDTPSFWDFLDVINPLQHIPVVSTLYRAVTGDEIGAVPRIVGGTLFGGPLGLLGAVANEVVRADTGQDLGEHALAFLMPGKGETAPSQVAANSAGQSPAGDDSAFFMQPFDAPEPSLAAAPEPPAILAQPQQPVETQPLPLPSPAPSQAPTNSGAIAAGKLFTPLNRPLTTEPAATEALPETPTTEVPPAPVAAAPDKIVPLASSPLLAQMASAGDLQPMLVKSAPPPPAPTAEAKNFAPKTSALQHGKMYAAAAPYMNKTPPAQKVAHEQGIPANHPMLKAAEAGQADWMAGAMTQALEKYSRSQKLLPEEPAAQPAS